MEKFDKKVPDFW